MRNRRAFTLVEMLIVMGIVALLAAILFPTFSRVKEKSKQSVCVSNLHQWWVGYRMAADDAGVAITATSFASAQRYVTARYFKCPDDVGTLGNTVSYWPLVNFQGADDTWNEHEEVRWFGVEAPLLLDFNHRTLVKGPWIAVRISGSVYSSYGCQPFPLRNDDGEYVYCP